MRLKLDSTIATEQWDRYAYMRDSGHSEFVAKADRCWRFVGGQQWESADKARLEAQRRPALTLNQILPTYAVLAGEQIDARTEISFRPRTGGDDLAATAVAMNKLYKQILDNNKYEWLRSQVFQDAVITGRGFFDVRMGFSDNMLGEVVITTPNPKNVVVDPDAEEYDPKTWNDVVYTKWYSPAEMSAIWGKDIGNYFKEYTGRVNDADIDSVDRLQDTFGSRNMRLLSTADLAIAQQRNVRVIDRQFRDFVNTEVFVNPQTGDMRPVPTEWDDNRIASVVAAYGLIVIKKPLLRVKWCTTAHDVVLHNDVSPYNSFTIVPYFPFFFRGAPCGIVEHLLDPQEYYNKISSQELHVVNTTANSGWKVKSGTLVNMTIPELEQRGAETGLVMEISGDPTKDVEKIQPNQYPSGLDRISYKAAESIKTISGVTDTMLGQDREDVAAKAIALKRTRGAVPLKPVMDNLVRTDVMVAERVLELVQTYYTEPRVMQVTSDAVRGETETIELNQPQPGTDKLLNDLTLGEYSVVYSSQPVKEAFEDSQFEQALALRELGVAIPDDVLIQNSRLLNKNEILQKMAEAASSPEAQAQQDQQNRAVEAEIAKTQAEAQAKLADTQARLAKAEATAADLERKNADLELRIHEQTTSQYNEQDREDAEFVREQQREDARLEADLQREETQARHEAVLQMQQAALNPPNQGD